MGNIKYTRKQYLNKECDHRQYYAQFVTEEIKRAVLFRIGKERILNSTDPYFNDIPLKMWDSIYSRPRPGYNQTGDVIITDTFGLRPLFEEAGEFITPGSIVCVLKEAAQQIKETGC